MAACGANYRNGTQSECDQCTRDAWHDAGHVGHVAVARECSDPEMPFPRDNKIALAFCDLSRGGAADGFFSFEKTPIAAYCVERRAASFAEYASCNAPEAGNYSTPTNPICICACFADRLIAHQTNATVFPHCRNPQHAYPQCNCSKDSVLLPPNSRSLNHIGREAVYCPYYYYTQAQPSYDPLKNRPCGFWYSFPRDGECQHGSVSWSGSPCTWKSEPTVMVAYGTDLLAEGWDKSLSFDQHTGVRLNTTQQTLANSRVFSRTLERKSSTLFSHVRCCGC